MCGASTTAPSTAAPTTMQSLFLMVVFAFLVRCLTMLLRSLYVAVTEVSSLPRF